MHDVKKLSDHQAAAEAKYRQPTTDERFTALEGSVSMMAAAVQGLTRKDSADKRDDDDKRRDDDLDQRIADAVARAFKKHRDDDRRHDRRKYDDDKRDDAGDTDDLKDGRPEWAEPQRKAGGDEDDLEPGRPEYAEPERRDNDDEPEPMAADDDRARDDRRDRRRHDARADARRQRADELDLYEAQAQYNEAFMAMEGKQAPKPISGHSARTYRLFCAKPLQQYCEKWKNVDLAKLAKTDPQTFAVVETEIRADAIRIGSNPSELQRYKSDGHLLREIRRQDRAGRWISEFVGPIDAPNGALAPFKMPMQRVVSINKNPNG